MFSLHVEGCAIEEEMLGAVWQRCTVHFMRNMAGHGAKKDRDALLTVLRSIFAQDSAGHYRFSFPAERHTVSNPDHSDLSCLARGHVSRTRLDLMALGMQPR